MKRTLALGGIAAGLLASAIVATPAHADSIPGVTLAQTNLAAQQVAAFWYGEAKANLVNATPYAVETKVATKHVSGDYTSASDKPGVVGSSGDVKPTTAVTKNINLPRTVGKVFFIGADHKTHWCTGTSVQSHYGNLVATAGHCVYDTASDKATLDKWVFVPGYYQGKTPYGLYVGKTAYTNSDFSVYEDGDKDYAFVTVYSGVEVTEASATRVGQWINGGRTYDTKALAQKAQAELVTKNTGYAGEIVPVPDYTELAKRGEESIKGAVTIDKWCELTNIGATQIEALVRGESTDVKLGRKAGYTVTRIAKDEFESAGTNHRSADGKTYYFAKGDGYYKATFWVLFDVDYKLRGKVLDIKVKDLGSLGSHVGGQGLAYNQKVGSAVFMFGYPSGSHPDGTYAFSGKTLKWSYGKTAKAAAPAVKAEELVSIKSSFTGEGSLGSAWLSKYNNGKRLGYLNGVTIGVADTDSNQRIDTSVSPYFDGETLSVYNKAAAQPSGKIA